MPLALYPPPTPQNGLCATQPADSKYPALWQGMHIAYPFFLHATGDHVLNYGINSAQKLIALGSGPIDWSVSKGWIGIQTDPSIAPQFEIPHPSRDGFTSQQFTVLAWISGVTDSSLARFIWSFENGQHDLKIGETANTVSFTCRQTADREAASTSDPADGLSHVVIGVADRTDDNNCKIYYDGALEGTSSSFTGDIPWDAYNTARRNVLFRLRWNNTSSNWNNNGSIHAFYHWNRKLSRQEIDLLSRDPRAPFRLKHLMIPVAVDDASPPVATEIHGPPYRLDLGHNYRTPYGRRGVFQSPSS